MFYCNIRANLALIILLCSEILSPQKKIRICFWKKKIKILMKYLHITCGDTLSFSFFLCGGEGEFSGQGFFLGGAGSKGGEG
jgi:hypothetical protein